MNVFLRRWFLFNRRFKFYIIIFWFVLACVCSYYALKFVTSTRFELKSPPGTPGHRASYLYNTHFATRPDDDHTIIVVVHSDSHVLTSFTQNVSLSLRNHLMTFPFVIDFLSYYTFIEKNYPQLATELVSNNNRVTLIEIAIAHDHPPGDLEMGLFIDEIRETIKYYVDIAHKSIDNSTRYYFGVTGEAALFRDLSLGAPRDIEKSEPFVLPIAMLLLTITVKSWRIIFGTILSLAVSISVSFSIMYPISLQLPVPPFTPPIMLALCLALNVDYSLFMISRFREELESGSSITKAVRIMLFNAGKTCIVSGFMMSIAFFGLVLFPMNMIQTIGLGGGISILCTIIVNITLIPSLFLSFHCFAVARYNDCSDIPFCEYCSCSSCNCDSYNEEPVMDLKRQQAEWLLSVKAKQCSKLHPTIPNTTTGIPTETSIGNLPPSYQAAVLHKEDSFRLRNSEDSLFPSKSESSKSNIQAVMLMQQSFWYKSAQFSTKPLWAIIIIIVVFSILAPLSYEAIHMKRSVSFDQFFPRKCESRKSMTIMSRDFQGGLLNPFEVLITIKKNDSTTDNIRDFTSIFTQEFYDNFCPQLVETIVNANFVNLRQVISICYLNSTKIPFALAKLAFDDTQPFFNSSEAREYRYLFNLQTNSAYTATVFSLRPSLDSFSDSSLNWVLNIRKLLIRFMSNFYSVNYSKSNPILTQSQLNEHNIELSLHGSGVANIDNFTKLYAFFPIQVALICLIVFVTVSFAFRSIIHPIRVIVTVALPISAIFGIGVLVFEGALLDFIFQLGGPESMHWLEPLILLSLLVALALDYDIFLFCRIAEFRENGFSTRASIICAVFRTGKIISMAGCIMAVAFSALSFSEVPLLKEFGFMLCLSVLLDTFVVRTLLVPAIVSLIGEANWYPGNRSDPKKDELQCHEFDGDNCEDEEEDEYAVYYEDRADNFDDFYHPTSDPHP